MAALTPERRAVLEERLSKLEEAEIDMVGGSLTSSVSHGDSGSNRSQSFGTPPGLQALREKISMIKRELGMHDPYQQHPLVPDNYC